MSLKYVSTEIHHKLDQNPSLLICQFCVVADADAVTPSRNIRSYTRRSVPSSPGRLFLAPSDLFPILELLYKQVGQCKQKVLGSQRRAISVSLFFFLLQIATKNRKKIASVILFLKTLRCYRYSLANIQKSET